MIFRPKKEALIFISPHCNLQCLGCQIHESETLSYQRVLDSIKSGTFLAEYGAIECFNIYGGDPGLSDASAVLISFLHSEGKKCRVWCNSATSIEFVMTLSDYVAEWVLYLPVVDPDRYQLQVGKQTFSQCRQMISRMTLEGLPVILHTPITDLSLPDIPEIVDFSLEFSCPLWLHYPRTAFSKERRKDIHYFERFSTVSVFSLGSEYSPRFCQVPIQDPKFYWAFWKSQARKWLKSWIPSPSN